MEYYFMNKTTGELLDGEDAIREFYSHPENKNKIDWLEGYVETRIPIPQEKVKPLINPTTLFSKAIKI